MVWLCDGDVVCIVIAGLEWLLVLPIRVLRRECPYSVERESEPVSRWTVVDMKNDWKKVFAFQP
jgi:hypothetical protein